MKIKYYAKFNGYKKTTSGWALKLLSIKDAKNVTVAREGTLDLTKGNRYLGELVNGDLMEFEAEVKGISLEYPKNIKKTNKKNIAEIRNKVSVFFDIKE
jgi:hypothetical protein